MTNPNKTLTETISDQNISPRVQKVDAINKASLLPHSRCNINICFSLILLSAIKRIAKYAKGKLIIIIRAFHLGKSCNEILSPHPNRLNAFVQFTTSHHILDLKQDHFGRERLCYLIIISYKSKYCRVAIFENLTGGAKLENCFE